MLLVTLLYFLPIYEYFICIFRVSLQFSREESNISGDDLVTGVDQALEREDMEYLDVDFRANIKDFMAGYADKVSKVKYVQRMEEG